MPDLDRIIALLGRLELQQKHLGLINHAYGVRLAISAIQEDAAAQRSTQPIPTPERKSP